MIILINLLLILLIGFVNKCSGYILSSHVNKKISQLNAGVFGFEVGIGDPDNKNKLDDAGSIEEHAPSPLSQLMQQITHPDPLKEKSRKYRRTIFTSPDWKKHRSAFRYIDALKSMPRSNVLRGLFLQAMAIALITASIVGWNLTILAHGNSLLNGMIKLPLLSIPPLPFSLTSPSLGLLLVFRTNAAYARWKDARILWGSVTARSFDLIRQGVSWLPTSELKAELVRHTAAFSRCLKWHLGDRTKIERLRADLSTVVNQDELNEYMNSRNKPQWSLLKIGDVIRRARLLPNVQSHMDKSIVALSNSYNACNRIYTTPIPLVYTRHTARFLFLWLITIPMAMFNEFPRRLSWAIVPINFLHSIFLMGIEELGVQIEEPFGILALGKMCREIERSGEEVLGANRLSWFGDVVQDDGTKIFLKGAGLPSPGSKTKDDPKLLLLNSKSKVSSSSSSSSPASSTELVSSTDTSQQGKSQDLALRYDPNPMIPSEDTSKKTAKQAERQAKEAIKEAERRKAALEIEQVTNVDRIGVHNELSDIIIDADIANGSGPDIIERVVQADADGGLLNVGQIVELTRVPEIEDHDDTIKEVEVEAVVDSSRVNANSNNTEITNSNVNDAQYTSTSSSFSRTDQDSNDQITGIDTAYDIWKIEILDSEL